MRRLHLERLAAVLRSPFVAERINQVPRRAVRATGSVWRTSTVHNKDGRPMTGLTSNGATVHQVTCAEILRTYGPARASLRAAFGSNRVLPVMGPQFRNPDNL